MLKPVSRKVAPIGVTVAVFVLAVALLAGGTGVVGQEQANPDDDDTTSTTKPEDDPPPEPEQPVVVAYGDGPVRFGIDAQYPPSNFVNDDGEIDGFEPELRDEVCRRAQLECVWVRNEWVSLMPNLIAGEFDVILTLMYNTPERDELIDFSEVYQPSAPSVYVSKAGAGEDVIRGVVAAISATVQADYVDKQTSATLLALDTQQEIFEAVLSGAADALLNDIGSARRFVAESDGALEIVGDEVEFPRLGSAMGFREEDDDLRAKISAVIVEMKADGSLNALSKKWFEEDALLFDVPMNGDMPTG